MATATAPRLLPEVEKFLAGAPLKGVVGGKDVAGSTGATMATRDPGTGDTIAEFCVLEAADVDAAVKAANHAFKHSGWATMSPNERGAKLHRLADALEKHKPIIGQIESLDAGKILGQALGDVQNCVDTLRYFTDMACHVQRRNVLAVSGRRGTRGAPAASSSPGTFPSCSSAGASRRRSPPATRSSSSPPRTRRCRRSTWPGWPARSAFPTA
jgi:aldehyde dehydrogenase (NAD+)